MIQIFKALADLTFTFFSFITRIAISSPHYKSIKMALNMYIKYTQQVWPHTGFFQQYLDVYCSMIFLRQAQLLVYLHTMNNTRLSIVQMVKVAQHKHDIVLLKCTIFLAWGRHQGCNNLVLSENMQSILHQLSFPNLTFVTNLKSLQHGLLTLNEWINFIVVVNPKHQS